MQIHRHSCASLYRTLIESATKYLSSKQSKVIITPNHLESSVGSALNYFGNNIKTTPNLSSKVISIWRETVTKRKLLDRLNEHIHNETPVDIDFINETWNTMKSYIIACLTIS